MAKYEDGRHPKTVAKSIQDSSLTWRKKQKWQPYVEFFQDELPDLEVLDAYVPHKHHKLVYLAVRTRDSGIVFCIMALLSFRGRGCQKENFAYRLVSETENPPYYTCTPRILDILTPTTDESANLWRKRNRMQVDDWVLVDTELGGNRVQCEGQILAREKLWIALDLPSLELQTWIPHTDLYPKE